MATYLLDTNIIIDALNAKRDRNALLLGLAGQGNLLACCPVNVAEVYAGVRPKEEQHTAALLRSLQLLPITFEIAEMAGRLRQRHSRKGKTLSVADTIVAAVAIHYRLTLITDNTRDFPMKELSLFPFPN